MRRLSGRGAEFASGKVSPTRATVVAQVCPSLYRRLVPDATNIWDDVPDWGGTGARRLVRAGRGLGGSIWELQPGQPEYVYHFHYGSDELLIVLRGTPKLRTSDGERTLREGDVVPLPRGPEGARAISNPSDAVVRILMLSSNADPDVAEYPETGKIGVITDGRTWEFFPREDAAENAL
jgi:quercetin dioxygenase-like cupin family protein